MLSKNSVVVWHLTTHHQAVTIHYNDVTMSVMASQIPSLTIVYSTVYSGADQRKHQSSASLASMWGMTGEFPAQRVSNAEKVSIWWRHHEDYIFYDDVIYIYINMYVFMYITLSDPPNDAMDVWSQKIQTYSKPNSLNQMVVVQQIETILYVTVIMSKSSQYFR